MGKKNGGRFSAFKCLLCFPEEHLETEAEAEAASYDEQGKKSTYAVAMAATSAAMEAAVAANNAAAEIFRLISLPRENPSRRVSAAIKIQSLYRGHLGRKALSALKGVVKLQALIRGELTRRRAVSRRPVFTKQPQKLKKITSQQHHNLDQKGTIQMDGECKHKESMENFCKQESSNAKREIMKRHSYSLKEKRSEPSTPEFTPNETIQKSLFVQCEEPESCQQWKEKEIHRRLSLSFDLNESRLVKLKLKTAANQDNAPSSNPLISPARRSLSYSPKSNRDYYYTYLPNSFTTPMYMAPTESTKAKTKQHQR